MYGLSLFTGTGIGELAFKLIFSDYQTVGYVEWDKYCQAIIRTRIADGILDEAPIFGDIRHFNAAYASLYAGKVDWLSGGFPCQPFSVAGHQLGEADERNMWPATRDAIRIIRPRYVLLENVPGLLAHRYIQRVFGDLAEMRYDCEWDVVGASNVGAPHRRKRIWILAYPNGARHISQMGAPSKQGANKKTPDSKFGSRSTNRNTLFNPVKTKEVADTPSIHAQGRNDRQRQMQSRGSGWWTTEPDVGRVANGVASRVDRLKALGNGWVPQVARRILEVTTP